MSGVVGSLLGLLVVGLGLHAADESTASGPPVTIAFAATPGPHVWLMNVDTGAKRRLTRGRYAEESPSWAPGGGRLAYSETRRLRVPDGSVQIQPRIVVLNLRTGARRMISNGSVPRGSVGVIDEEPAWSPDGRRIAWVRTVIPPGSAEEWSQIWIMRADGSGARQLTRTRVNNYGPAWSPNGGLIGFSRLRRGGVKIDIWVMRPDGSRQRRLIPDASRPSWSPDGRQIAYGKLTRKTIGCCTVTDLMLANANGANRRLLVREGGRATWSADGARIVFQRYDRLAASHLWIVNTDGTGLRRLTRRPGGQSAPAWRRFTTTLRVGYVTTPQHPYGIGLSNYNAVVERASGWTLTINPLPGASNGNDATLLDDVSSGSIEMAAVSAAVWDGKGVSVFEPLQAPFLITNYLLDRAVLGGAIGNDMLADPNGPPKLGLVGLGLLEGGLRKPVGRSVPLTSVASFQGKKIRAPASPVMTSALTNLGATPVAMPLPEVGPALRNGTLDGLEANYGLIATQRWYEDAKYVTANITMWPFPAPLVINRDVWDELTPAQQQALVSAGKRLASTQIQNVFLNPPANATNFVEQICGEGMTIAIASNAEIQALASKVQPTLDDLANNPTTAPYLKRIQDAKAAQTPPTPAPLPSNCRTTP